MEDLNWEWQNEKLEILGLKDKGSEKGFLIACTSTMGTRGYNSLKYNQKKNTTYIAIRKAYEPWIKKCGRGKTFRIQYNVAWGRPRKISQASDLRIHLSKTLVLTLPSVHTAPHIVGGRRVCMCWKRPSWLENRYLFYHLWKIYDKKRILSSWIGFCPTKAPRCFSFALS